MKTNTQKKSIGLVSMLALLLMIFNSYSCKKSHENKNNDVQQQAAPLEYIHFNIDNLDSNFIAPADTVKFHGNGAENQLFNTVFGVTGIHYQGTDSNYVLISFSSYNIAQGSSQRLDKIMRTGYNFLIPSSPVYVNITEYGAIGQFISGNFTGTFADLSNNAHVVSADFRMKRNN